jgi:hypothetical protein
MHLASLVTFGGLMRSRVRSLPDSKGKFCEFLTPRYRNYNLPAIGTNLRILQRKGVEPLRVATWNCRATDISPPRVNAFRDSASPICSDASKGEGAKRPNTVAIVPMVENHQHRLKITTDFGARKLPRKIWLLVSN